MFRTALIRTAAQASRVARPAVFRVPAARGVAPATAVSPSVAPRWAAVRMYSAAASGDKKSEVEGRILSILQGFDKVSSH